MVLAEPGGAELVAATLGELGVGPFDLPQVRVPTGGGVAWTYETSRGPEVTKALDVVIAIARANLRKWYRTPFGEGEAGPPDCASEDNLRGFGINTIEDAKPDWHECPACPWSQFGSDRVTRTGKDCSEYMLVYAFRLDSMLPDVVVVPPTSLKTFRKYVLQLAGEGKRVFQVITRLTLESAERGGFPTAIIKPQALRALTIYEAERMKAVVAAVLAHGAKKK